MTLEDCLILKTVEVLQSGGEGRAKMSQGHAV